MSAESPRHARSGGPLTVPSQPPKDRSLIDAVSGFINDVTLSSSSSLDPKDVIQWARFETADINEPTPEGDADADTPPLLLVLGYGAGVQVWLIPPAGEAQEVLSWRQGTVRVLRVLPTPQQADCFASKRPLIALCDSASPGPSFCSLSFISIRGGEQVKSIKFKNPILDVLANKRSVVVSFSERFAVFDAGTLEDRLAVTTCYPCPCPLGGSAPINPLSLGDRWLAYADKKLNPSKRSSGGCEGEGVASYTATVLYAAKSLSKGLRGLSESVAAGLAGARGTSQSPSPPNADAPQPGVITILDIEGNDEDEGRENEESYDPTVAHFIAHSEAIIALKFDASGMLLVTADRRGHDFHVFRINPHPCGPSLASVHHLYVLHRGDTTAKVQDIAISADSRWTAVSTLRGTTHVFATSTYGGACGVRTHTAPRVVNRLSRFHRSAGLAAGPHKGAGPVSEGAAAGGWFPNPRLPPYPQPVLAAPLAQLRTTHLPTHTITRTSSGRQRLSSLSEDGGFPPLLSRAHFGPAAPGAAAGRHTALYLMAAHGTLTQLLLRPAPLAAVPKEKICDESPIELQVEPVAQWGLQRPPAATDLLAPLPPSNPLLQPLSCRRCADMCLSEEERWLSQVEIVTHAGPHRRLWMGPQFVFKMYCTGSNSSLSEAETVEVDTSAARGVARSNPVNMPVVPVLIDSGSASSLEHSPSDSYRRKSLLAESGRAASVCDVQLKEDLAEAMKEDHGWLGAEAAPAPRASGVARAVDPQGTVVAPGPRVEPPQPDDCAAPNADEATFRPVLRAPAPPAPPDLPVRPLPRGTTLPVQPAPPLASPPAPPALALTTDVVIPAALGPAYSDFEFDSPLRKSDLEAAADDESYLDSTVANNLERMTTRASDDVDVVRERSSVSDERERKVDVESLPKLYSAPDDIQPAARVRVKKSPTPKSVSDTEVSDVIRVKDAKCREIDKPEKVKGSETKKVTVKELETKEITFSEPAPVEVSEPKDVVDLEPKTCDLTVSQQKQKNVSELKEIKVSEPKKLETLDSQDIIVSESNEKKVLISKEASDSESKEVNLEQRKVKSSEHKEVNVAEIKEVQFSDKKEIKAAEPRSQEIRDVKGSRDKTSKQSNKLSKEKKDAKIVEDTKQKYSQTKIEETWDGKGYKDKSQKNNKSLKEKKDITVESGNEKHDTRVTTEVVASPTVVTPMVKLSSKKETSPNRVEKRHQDEIKTEDQAWDMLLNEPDKLVSNVTSALQMPVVTEKTCDASKGKVKKNRKSKKAFDESTTKTDDDSFVEIHTIDDKQQSSGGNLVAISTFEESIDFCSMAKTKKVRGTKSVTPERNYDYGKSDDIWGLKRDDSKIQTSLNITHNEDFSNTDFCDPLVLGKSKESYKEKDVPKAKTHKEGTLSETTSFIAKEIPKQLKSKSLSPYLQGRKYSDANKKDVYIIDTAEEDFPEIQITHSNKARKRSPKPVEATSQEEEIVIEKPVKSWSSIAASKSSNKTKDVSRKVEMQEIEMDFPSTSKYTEKEEHDEKQAVLKGISLHEKLFELCKRTDIMVAECDTPTELSFVDEHVLTRDLPPLEPLDFGLEEFKLDIMKDSLLDIKNTKVTSPICKINIDDILSSIKETTSKVIESSSFNLIDVEKVPAKIEKGFNVIESDKITSQEVILEADGKLGSELVEIMEKSSDEENTPIGSTDSDKEDKKNIGASNVLPSIKQSAKPKKSRRKKK